MSRKKFKKLEDEREILLAEMCSLSGMLHGSWLERYSTCSRPGCACHRGERHGPRRYLVVNVGGRQRQKYIPNDKAPAALEGVAQHRRLLELVDRITVINLILLKEEE